MLSLIEDSLQFTILCFVVRGFEALGASAYSTASYVFVVNAFPDSIGSVLGILETFIGLGMSVGPAIGGFLYSVILFTYYIPYLIKNRECDCYHIYSSHRHCKSRLLDNTTSGHSTAKKKNLT